MIRFSLIKIIWKPEPLLKFFLVLFLLVGANWKLEGVGAQLVRGAWRRLVQVLFPPAPPAHFTNLVEYKVHDSENFEFIFTFSDEFTGVCIKVPQICDDDSDGTVPSTHFSDCSVVLYEGTEQVESKMTPVVWAATSNGINGGLFLIFKNRYYNGGNPSQLLVLCQDNIRMFQEAVSFMDKASSVTDGNCKTRLRRHVGYMYIVVYTSKTSAIKLVKADKWKWVSDVDGRCALSRTVVARGHFRAIILGTERDFHYRRGIVVTPWE